MHRSYPWYDLKDIPKFLKHNRIIIKNYLYPEKHLITRLILRSDSSINLEISNNADTPVEIESISIRGEDLNLDSFELNGRLSQKKNIRINNPKIINLIKNNLDNFLIDINISNKSIGTRKFKNDITKAYIIMILKKAI